MNIKHRKTSKSDPKLIVAMKEKSKNAARKRRENENVEFTQLNELLPLPHEITQQLDKASVIRLTTSYLKMRQVFPDGLGGARETFTNGRPPVVKELRAHLLRALDGFVFIIAADGKITYISESASAHLGLSQVELTGNSIFDYIHADDRDGMERALALHPHDFTGVDASGCATVTAHRKFVLRMKCVLGKRSAGLTTQGFKTIHCTGHVKSRHTRHGIQSLGIVAVGHTLTPLSATDIKLTDNMFVFRTSMDLKLLYADDRVTKMTEFTPAELIDKTIYQLVHAADVEHVRDAHITLLSKGQATSNYYRLLTKSGGWVWVQSSAAIVQNSRTSYIVSANYVLSEKEAKHWCLSETQMSASCTLLSSKPTLCNPPNTFSTMPQTPPSMHEPLFETSQSVTTASPSFQLDTSSSYFAQLDQTLQQASFFNQPQLQGHNAPTMGRTATATSFSSAIEPSPETPQSESTASSPFQLDTASSHFAQFDLQQASLFGQPQLFGSQPQFSKVQSASKMDQTSSVTSFPTAIDQFDSHTNHYSTTNGPSTGHGDFSYFDNFSSMYTDQLLSHSANGSPATDTSDSLSYQSAESNYFGGIENVSMHKFDDLHFDYMPDVDMDLANQNFSFLYQKEIF